jgi:hypothetical protein
VAPTGVVTVTVLAPAVRVQIAFTDVGVDALTVQVLPVPDTFTAVAPARPVPVRVSRTPVPLLGPIEVSDGPCTVKVWALLVPPGVVTLTFPAPIVAVAVIVKVVVIVVEFTTVMVPTVTPVPDTATLVPDAVKFVPVSVTGTAVPAKPLLGVIETSVGARTGAVYMKPLAREAL